MPGHVDFTAAFTVPAWKQCISYDVYILYIYMYVNWSPAVYNAMNSCLPIKAFEFELCAGVYVYGLKIILIKSFMWFIYSDFQEPEWTVSST